MLRSAVAILVGIATLTILSFAIETAVDPLLVRMFPEALPTPETLASNPRVKALTLAYGLVCVAFGGYITARVARRRPIQHAAAMGIIQAGLTIVAMMSPVAKRASRLQWITNAILCVPAALAGGAIYKGRKPDDRLQEGRRGTTQ